jgi:hypothetical protein
MEQSPIVKIMPEVDAASLRTFRSLPKNTGSLHVSPGLVSSSRAPLSALTAAIERARHPGATAERRTTMNQPIRNAIITAVFASVLAATAAQAQLGQTALSRCYDRVVAACNKKSDAAVNPCANSGLDQCDAEHKAQIQLPQTEISKLRANAMRRINVKR